MKKIEMKHDNKDRIICVSLEGKHMFYYQPSGTKERFWMFDTKTFSGSVFAFFRKHGIVDGFGFGMTLKQLYAIGSGTNEKLNKLMDRIPAQVEYVLREREESATISRIAAYAQQRDGDAERVA